MANPQHIGWLMEGVEAWNARREREEFEGADIRTQSSVLLNIERVCYEPEADQLRFESPKNKAAPIAARATKRHA